MPIVAAFEREGKVRHVAADRPIGACAWMCASLMFECRNTFPLTGDRRHRSIHPTLLSSLSIFTTITLRTTDQVYADVRKALQPLDAKIQALI